jgi:hypothetical protein
MATLTVTTSGDVVDPSDGELSLREALAEADATTAADTIVFDGSVQGRTIVLAGSQLTVASDVTIDGGAGVTLDADEKSRVLLVQGGTGDQQNDVTLRYLTITGGRTTGAYEAGGGILAYTSSYGLGVLTLDHATVRGNSTAGGYGGGISGGYVTLTDSTVSGNRASGGYAQGGGIHAGVVTLNNSTVSNNDAAAAAGNGRGLGGGIFVFSSLTLTDSTVSGNRASGGYAQGGGIYASTFGFSEVTLTNSTVSGNSTAGDYASGGGIFGGYVRLVNSTVSGNAAKGANAEGGGISQTVYGTIVANSIVAGNTSSDTDPDVAGRISSNGLNVFGSDVDGNAPSDRENVPVGVLFAGGLADNGGPTQTIALRDDPANPALGRADPTDAPATDQRGVARPEPAGTDPDIGAFELAQSDPPDPRPWPAPTSSPPRGTSRPTTAS